MVNNKDKTSRHGSHNDLTEVLLKLAKTRERDEVFEVIINYLTSTIEGSGCSIFLVNPSTDELNMVASSHILKNEWDKCTYKRGKGFTGWSFKHKRLLYIPDETDLDYIMNIKPEPPVHVGEKGGKPCETPSIGPFMAVPIISKDYVIGVIRLPMVRGKKKKYTPEERELFQTFAARLSKSIESANLIEKQNNLIHTYAKIGKANDLTQLLNGIVKDIPEIVGGGGCSVFLFEGERTEDGKKKFILKASTSVKEDFKTLIGTFYHYVEKEPGVTAWVATTGKPIRVDNINDPAELNKKRSAGDLKIIHPKRPCEIDDVGPFLAAPIKDEDETIGVIRIPRRKESKPFEEIDEELLVAFADQLSLTIGNIKKKKTIDDIRKKRAKEFETKFSTPLIDACKNVSKVDYANEVKEFLDFPDKDEYLDTEIMNSLEVLWCDKYGKKYNFPLLGDFRGYEKMLFELPRYRDHFIHQYQVFLLGTVIIDGLYKRSEEKETKNFPDFYHESLNIKNKNDIVADIAWLITSTFHDVAYPIQKSDELFNRFFDKFMDLGEQIVDRIGLEKIISDRRYGKLIDQLCDFYFSLQNKKGPWKFDSSPVTNISVDNNFRWAFQHCLIKIRDHGVLGSLILLHQSEAGKEEYSTIIYPSALAIALHNKLLFGVYDDITFEKNPLAFLLRYCDLVQEWGRGEKDVPETPTLKEIKVYYDDKDSTIHVRTKIRLESRKLADDKAKEADQVFNKLKSNEIKFEFTIEDNDRTFESKGY